MKEKLKKAFEKVTVNLFMAWTNLVIFAYLVGLSICEAEYTAFVIALPFLLIALLAFDCHRKEKELRTAKFMAAMEHLFGLKLYKELERYKQKYGELPPEEENTAAAEESEKKNSGNAPNS